MWQTNYLLHCSLILLNEGKWLKELWGLAGVNILTEKHVHVLMHLAEPDRRRALSSQLPVTLLSLPFSSLPSPPHPRFSQHVSVPWLHKPEKLTAPITEILWPSRLFPMILPVAQERPIETVGLSHMPDNKCVAPLKSPFIYFLCVYTYLCV